MNDHASQPVPLFGGRMLVAPCVGFGAHGGAKPSASDPQTIVVAAERLPQAAARERALGFVRTTGVAAGETPAARWVDPICPGVAGLVDAAARAAERRICRIATRLGAQVAAESCERNVVVTFASDGAALARRSRGASRGVCRELSPGAREQVLTGSAPIRWWYTTEVRSRHGAQNGGAGHRRVETTAMRGRGRRRVSDGRRRPDAL